MTVRTIGNSKIRSTDRTASFLRKLAMAKQRATTAMAEEAKRQAEEIFSSDGDGTWDPNAPSTVTWKGHEKIMLGRTGALSKDIEIRQSENNPLNKAVGWFDDGHPDTDGRLSKGALAAIHEEDRPWLSKVHDNPTRAEAVLNAGKKQYLGGL